MEHVIFGAYISGYQAKSTKESPFNPTSKAWLDWMSCYYDK